MAEPDGREGLLEELEPLAWELVAAVHARKPEWVAAIIDRAGGRADVLAILLADQMPRPRRARLNGKGEVECGTDDGYREHRVRGEDACAQCRTAHSVRNAGYRKAKRERDRQPARLATLQSIALGERQRPAPDPTWSAYVTIRAHDRSPDRWVLHAMSTEAELSGLAAPEAECGREAVEKTGPWDPTDPRNCAKCARLVDALITTTSKTA